MWWKSINKWNYAMDCLSEAISKGATSWREVVRYLLEMEIDRSLFPKLYRKFLLMHPGGKAESFEKMKIPEIRSASIQNDNS